MTIKFKLEEAKKDLKLHVSTFKLLFSYYMLFKTNREVVDIENKSCTLKEFVSYIMSKQEEKSFLMQYMNIYLFENDCENLGSYFHLMYKAEGVQLESIDIEQEDTKDIVKIVLTYIESIFNAGEYLFQLENNEN